jgi:hypothetical protein
MPKSKHGRGKHYRKANVVRPPTTATTDMTQQPAANMSMATPPTVPTAAPKMPAQKRGTATAALPLHYEFIPGDLKRIGILSVIIIAILIVLFFVLK